MIISISSFYCLHYVVMNNTVGKTIYVFQKSGEF